MSASRSSYNGPVEFSCDACGECLDTDESEWKEAIAFIKRYGWKVAKVLDEWMHFCPDCKRSNP